MDSFLASTENPQSPVSQRQIPMSLLEATRATHVASSNQLRWSFHEPPVRSLTSQTGLAAVGNRSDLQSFHSDSVQSTLSQFVKLRLVLAQERLPPFLIPDFNVIVNSDQDY
jgi:hypothetical protein